MNLLIIIDMLFGFEINDIIFDHMLIDLYIYVNACTLQQHGIGEVLDPNQLLNIPANLPHEVD